ncbi:centrosome-associated zinc finger protein CP190 [Agrilus planipennis]|uniref:Centrosome-associated zinc finger protein CP190 n=1 Tax=Agrilus planipennis TaxID=224129 RepID=A0A1W4WHA5_AGRPL|nr:centrosome-associated zinc finger protein CP190 [Agrilus planipennis]XP_018323315.1 centrosome-associated zinc finger protein CP190 [Agrilus planipennis]
MKMGEGIKQVRVDNWGVFFLQRLQMFFNKTDYCDLTLQFEGNVQLKVHRLVINACTEYFTYLEQTCGIHGDILIMPADLQADVVLPIVNFMYTGMLEFHMSVFEKLHKTATLMNITVLTKLLDALKCPSQPFKPQKINKRPLVTKSHNVSPTLPIKKAVKSESDLPAPLPGRKLPIWKRKTVPNLNSQGMANSFTELRKDPLSMYDSTPKPTRFEWPEDELQTLSLFDAAFDDISYTSQPLLTKEHEPKPSTSADKSKESSNGKTTIITVHEDVKEFLRETKRRSNLSEFNIDESSSDAGSITTESHKRKIDDKGDAPLTKKVRFNISEKENQNSKTKVNITHIGKTTPDLSHSKIITEVLKRYPHIVKKNKNIKLKILAKNNSNSPPPPNEKGQTCKTSASAVRVQVTNVNEEKTQIQKSIIDKKDGPWSCNKCSTPSEPCEFVLYYLYRKHMTDLHNEKFDPRLCKYCGHKYSKYDLLLYHQYTKHGIKPPSSHDFPKCNQCPYIAITENYLAKHQMNHTKFDVQCPECKVTFSSRHNFNAHVRITGHTGKSDSVSYDCQYCIKKFQNDSTLFSHIKMLHRDEAIRDGVVSVNEEDSFEDMEDEDVEALFNDQPQEEQQQQHQIDDKDVEEEEFITEEYITPDDVHPVKKDKIKILSNVKVDGKQAHVADQQQTITLQGHDTETETLTNVAGGIATSLGLVDIVVLDDNQQYILHSNDQHLTAAATTHNSNQTQPEFIIPGLTDTHTFCTTQAGNNHNAIISQTMLSNSDIASTDELVMVLTDHDYGDGNQESVSGDNSNIVVLYSHPAVGNEGQIITTTQGNIMINSETGVFELRNPENFVPISENSVLMGNGTQTANSQIESIEMIQREIDSHRKEDQKVVTTEVDKPIETSSQPIFMQEDIIIQTNSQMPRSEIEIQGQVEPDREIEQIQVEAEATEKPTEEKSESKIEIPTDDNRMVEETIHMEEAGENEDKEDSFLEDPTNESLSDAPMLTQQECFSSPHPIHCEDQQQLINDEEISSEEPKEVSEEIANESLDQVPKDENKEKEHNELIHEQIQLNYENLESCITEKPPENVVDDESVKTDHNDEEAGQQSKPTEKEYLTEVIIESPHNSFGDPQNHNNVNEQQIQQEIVEENIAADIEETRELSQNDRVAENQKENNVLNVAPVDSESEVSQSYSEKETEVKKEKSSSAKIILDEWEDTDSQQSGNTESKNSNTNEVHKLIDDWEDEDEEDSRKANP